MLIRIGHDITVRLFAPTAVIYLLRVHPSRTGDLVFPENFRIQPELPVEEYWDEFGNLCGRLKAPKGRFVFSMKRVLIARGRDAADVPITMTFGKNCLTNFSVTAKELDARSIAAWADFGEIRVSAKDQKTVFQVG